MAGESSCERIATYVIKVPYYGRPAQAPDESVARAINLSLGTEAKTYVLNEGGPRIRIEDVTRIKYKA